MGRILTLALAALLGGCAMGVYSEQPLFEKRGPQPADGLWALLPDGCAAPASASMTHWPECAVPVWIGGGTATTMVNMSLVHLPLIVADGEPHIIQTVAVQQPAGIPSAQAAPTAIGVDATATASDQSAPGFQYWAFIPDGPAPWRKAKLWPIGCPDKEMPGITKVDDQSCAAANAEAVRAAGRLAPPADKLRTAVWIAAQD